MSFPNIVLFDNEAIKNWKRLSVLGHLLPTQKVSRFGSLEKNSVAVRRELAVEAGGFKLCQEIF